MVKRSINIGQDTSKITVYKDEKGRYSTYIKGQEIKEDGTTKDIYMTKKLQFQKGIELKNKTQIEVIRGWNTCYKIKTEEVNEKGKSIYKYLDKYFIYEFRILQDGIDEVKKSYEAKQEEKSTEKRNTKNDFAFDFSEPSDLPF